jgi:hypothetical protein
LRARLRISNSVDAFYNEKGMFTGVGFDVAIVTDVFFQCESWKM